MSILVHIVSSVSCSRLVILLLVNPNGKHFFFDVSAFIHGLHKQVVLTPIWALNGTKSDQPTHSKIHVCHVTNIHEGMACHASVIITRICHTDIIPPDIAICTSSSVVEIIYEVVKAIVFALSFVIPWHFGLIFRTSSFTNSWVEPHITRACVHHKIELLSRGTDVCFKLNIVMMLIYNPFRYSIFLILLDWNIIVSCIMGLSRVSWKPERLCLCFLVNCFAGLWGEYYICFNVVYLRCV